MALAVTITYVADMGTQTRVGFKLAPSGTYVTGGDTINFATASQDPGFVGNVAQVVALGPPISLDAWSNGGNITTFYVPVVGTSPAAGNKLKVGTALGSEATGGSAYPASVLADTIIGEATFNHL
jgi:hypothetical protein